MMQPQPQQGQWDQQQPPAQPQWQAGQGHDAQWNQATAPPATAPPAQAPPQQVAYGVPMQQQPQYPPQAYAPAPAAGVPQQAPPPAAAYPPAGTQQPPPQAVGQVEAQQYPNPMGKYADIGRWRDAWFGIGWVLMTFILVVVGVSKASSGDIYRPSGGDTEVALRGSAIVGSSNASFTFDADSDCYSVQDDPNSYFISMACDETTLYALFIPKTTETADGKSMALTSGTCSRQHDRQSLKTDAATVKFDLLEPFPQTQNAPSIRGIDAMTVMNTQCRLLEGGASAEHWAVVVVSAIIAIIIGLGFVVLCKKYPVKTIKGCCIAFVVLCVLMAMYAAMIGAVWLLITCLLMAALTACFLYCAWDQIPFAGHCLQLSATVVLKYWGVIIAGFALTILSLIIVMFFAVAVGSKDRAVVTGGFFYLAVFILFWDSEVLQNLTHVTTVGVNAEWFFSLGGPGTPAYYTGEKRKTPSASSFRRAVTWSLGSVSMGSLVVTIIRYIRFLLSTCRDQCEVLACIVDCILGCIEDLMRYFNDYAFVQVGVYGKPYITAAQHTWDLVKSGEIWTGIINDALVDKVFVIFILLGTLLTAGIVHFIKICSEDTCSSTSVVLISALTAFFVLVIMMKLLYSGVMTVFICYADLLQQHIPWNAPDIDGKQPELAASLKEKTGR